MKANAPKKIYLYPSRLKKGKILGRWFMTRYNQDSVEYIRKDAFIEKACEWLRNNSYTYANNALGKEYLVNGLKTIWKESKLWNSIYQNPL